MDKFLIILIIIMLISAIAFNQGQPQPATPEWNPLEMFFHGYLGWNIVQTTAFCSGSIIFLAFILWIVGWLTGWSHGTIFGSSEVPHLDRDYNSLTYEERVEQGTARQANIQRHIFMPFFIIIVISFCVAIYLLNQF